MRWTRESLCLLLQLDGLLKFDKIAVDQVERDVNHP